MNEDTITQGVKNSSSAATWILLFVTAGLKDLTEIIFGLIPVIGSILVTVIGIGLSIIIFVLLWTKGLLKGKKFAGTVISQIADNLPWANILPVTFLTVLALYFLNKKGKTIKLPLNKTNTTKLLNKIKI